MGRKQTGSETENAGVLRGKALSILQKNGQLNSTTTKDGKVIPHLLTNSGEYIRNLQSDESIYILQKGNMHPATIRRIEAQVAGILPAGIAVSWDTKHRPTWAEIKNLVAGMPGSVFVPGNTEISPYWIIGEESDHIGEFDTVLQTLKQKATSEIIVTRREKVTKMAKPAMIGTTETFGTVHPVTTTTRKPVGEKPPKFEQPIVAQTLPEKPLLSVKDLDTALFMQFCETANSFDELITRTASAFPVSSDGSTGVLQTRINTALDISRESVLQDTFSASLQVSVGSLVEYLDTMLNRTVPTAPKEPETMEDTERYLDENAVYVKALTDHQKSINAVKKGKTSLLVWLDMFDRHATFRLKSFAEDEIRQEQENRAIKEASALKQAEEKARLDAFLSGSIAVIERKEESITGSFLLSDEYERALEFPKRRDHFKMVDTLVSTLSAVAYQLVIEGYSPHVLMTGLPGIGKTDTAKEFAAHLGYAFHRVDCQRIADSIQMFGKSGIRATATGPETYTEMSLFTYALQRPNTIIALDEINRFIDAQTASAIFSILDDSRGAWIQDLKQYIRIAPNVCIFATRNKDGDAGTTGTSDALLSRFGLHVDVKMPQTKELDEIITARWGIGGKSAIGGSISPIGQRRNQLTTSTSALIAKMITDLNTLFHKGDLSIHLGIRETNHACNMFQVGGSKTLRYSIAGRYDDNSVSGSGRSERMNVLQLIQTTFKDFGGTV